MRSVFLTALMVGLFSGLPSMAQESPATVVLNTAPPMSKAVPATVPHVLEKVHPQNSDLSWRDPLPKRPAENVHRFEFLTGLTTLAYGFIGGIGASMMLALLCMGSTCPCWRLRK